MAITLDGTNGGTTSAGWYAQSAWSGTYSDGIVVDYVTGNGRITVGSADGLTIYNGGTSSRSALVTLDSSGNLGLGVTPSGWYSATKALQLNAGAVYTYSTDRVFLGQNVYINSVSADTYYSTAPATTYRQYNGIHSWYNAPSGTAGAAISFTQAMTLDTSGNLGIGATAPNEKVTIASSSSASYIQICDSSTGTTSGDGLFLGSFNGAAELKTKENAALAFGTNNTERARIDSSGNLLVGTTSLSQNGNFTNALQTAVVSTNSTAKSFDSTYKVTATNNAAVDAWLSRDANGTVFGNNSMTGYFYVYVTGANGGNAFSGIYSLVTTGNGTLQATLTAVSTVTRGTSPVSTVTIANDGANGAVKLVITYINNSGVVTGGYSCVVFKGLIVP